MERWLGGIGILERGRLYSKKGRVGWWEEEWNGWVCLDKPVWFEVLTV